MEKVAVGVTAGTLAVLFLIAWRFFGPIATGIVIVLGVLAVQLELLYMFGIIRDDIERSYNQLDSLFSLHSMFRFRAPLPTMRGWAASPDFVKLVITTVLDRRPKTIVELGSGVSTLVSAYCLERLDAGGTIYSVEHQRRFVDRMHTTVRRHALGDHVELIHAPLKELEIEDTTYRWYDTELLASLDDIDMLVVDGPPSETGPMARYPALPVLKDRLARDAVILVDDAARKDEGAMVARWGQRYPKFELEMIEAEMGAARFWKTG